MNGKIVNDIKTPPFVPSMDSGLALSSSKDSERVFQQTVKIRPSRIARPRYSRIDSAACWVLRVQA